MLTPDQPQFVRSDLSGPYAKLARHVAAMYEIVRLAPTNDPSQPGNPPIGLSARDRMGVTEHLRECMEMIATLEKWMMNPVAVINPEPPRRNPAADWSRPVPEPSPTDRRITSILSMSAGNGRCTIVCVPSPTTTPTRAD